jgi:hypothetical protein
MMSRLRVSLVLLAALLLTPAAWAQSSGPPTGVRSIDEAMSRVYGGAVSGAASSPVSAWSGYTTGDGYYGRYYDSTYRPAVGEHWVNGYYRSNGTWVNGYYQTNADNSFWNNYSSYGNVNPHTGRVGTKMPSSRRGSR